MKDRCPSEPRLILEHISFGFGTIFRIILCNAASVKVPVWLISSGRAMPLAVFLGAGYVEARDSRITRW